MNSRKPPSQQKYMPEKEFQVAEHFNEKLANAYDEKIREIFSGYEGMHEAARYLLEVNTKSKASILIAGVGTGHEAISFARSRPHWEIVGFDPSASMLLKAKNKIKSQQPHGKIKLIQGFIQDVTGGTSFDGAVSILVMQFLSDHGEKQEYLAEISKRLHVGAKILVIDLEGIKYSKTYNNLMSAWKAQQLATRQDNEQVERDFKHVDKNVQFISEERLRQLLTEAGFNNICKFYQKLLLGGYIATKGER